MRSLVPGSDSLPVVPPAATRMHTRRSISGWLVARMQLVSQPSDRRTAAQGPMPSMRVALSAQMNSILTSHVFIRNECSFLSAYALAGDETWRRELRSCTLVSASADECRCDGSDLLREPAGAGVRQTLAEPVRHSTTDAADQGAASAKTSCARLCNGTSEGAAVMRRATCARPRAASPTELPICSFEHHHPFRSVRCVEQRARGGGRGLPCVVIGGAWRAAVHEDVGARGAKSVESNVSRPARCVPAVPPARDRIALVRAPGRRSPPTDYLRSTRNVLR